MIYPSNLESKILFDKVKEIVRDKCLSSLGENNVDNIKFSTNYNYINTELNKVDEFKSILFKYEDFPTNNYIDARGIVNKTDVDGAYISIEEMFDLKRSLDTVRSILRFFNNHKDEFPYLLNTIKNVNVHKYVLDRIDSIITSNGRIKDNASEKLQEIRRSLNYKKSSISKIVNTVLAKVKAQGWIDSDLSATYVNGRITIPIESTYKRKVKGMVHDVSATGKTTYLEPEEVVSLNNDIVDLENDERKEIYKILLEFTQDIRPYKDDILNSYSFLAEIDFIRAKAIYAKNNECIKPGLVNESMLRLFKAKHPILSQKLKLEGKEIVPLNIEINDNQRIILISGPNAGGKSVSLKTVALLQYMLQCGMLVPVGGSTEMGIFNNIFIDIGDEQSVENDLSTYSSHLFNMKYFLKNADDKTLFFIDEFGTGTEPLLGGAIAEAMLDELNKLNPKGIITTHYTNLKHFAVSVKGVENAAMLFDVAKIEPAYILDIGKPGSSFAFETARKIGISEVVLKNAEEKTGKDHIDFDKHLRQVLRDKKYWEDKRNRIKRNDRKLEEVVSKYQKNLAEIKQLKTEILKKAKEEAENIIKTANRTIESTVKDIKAVQADKEKTKEIRRKFEEQKKRVLQSTVKEGTLEQKLKSVEARIEQNYSDEKEVVKVDTSHVRVGDKVRLKDTRNLGEVVELNNKNAVVAFGNMLTSVSLKKIEKVSNKEYKNNTKSSQTSSNVSSMAIEKRSKFNPYLDLRGKRVDEAIEMVMRFVDEAVMFGFIELKILHGTGTGALRIALRNYLNTVDVVGSVKDEAIEFGGAGISIVVLDY